MSVRVLIVDDERDVEPLFLQRFRKELKGERLAFHFEFSAEAALEWLETAEAADLVLILSDINMPGMSGVELLKRIKDQWPHLPVIMITAYDDEDNYRKSMRYGADDYIAKPLDFELLKQKILERESRDAGPDNDTESK